MTKWTTEYPTKPGAYWFWGRRDPHSDHPQLLLVRAWEVIGGMVFGAEGYPMDDPSDAHWMPATLPDPPGATDKEVVIGGLTE